MKLFSYLFIFLALICASCSPKKASQISNNQKQENFTLTINALNLSEDVSLISTQNDELLFLLYTDLEHDFPTLISQNEFLLDTANRKKVILFETKIDIRKEIILVLIEMDTDQKLKDIEPIIRKNLKQLQEAQTNYNNDFIREILDDNDLLYLEKTDLKTIITKAIRIQGVNLFDAYDYVISLK